MSRCAGDGLVIMRTGITPGREGLFGSVFEASGARETRGSGGKSGFHGVRPELARACCCRRRGTTARPRYRRPTVKSRWPRRSQLPPRGERANVGRAPAPVYRGRRATHLNPNGVGGRATPRGRPAEARRATHGTSGTKAPATTDARAEGGSGAAQGRGSDPRERSGARARVGSAGAERIRGRDRQEAGSPRAGPGATGFGWAPPYLRSRLA